MSRTSGLAAFAALAIAACAAHAADTSKGEWPYYGDDIASTRYSPLAQIDAANVAQLQVVWRWNSPDNALAAASKERIGAFKATPLMIGGVLYTSTSLSQ